jgi:hypothetical protein
MYTPGRVGSSEHLVTDSCAQVSLAAMVSPVR